MQPSQDREPKRLNKARLPEIGFESYDSMEGLIAIDPGGPPQRFESWPRAMRDCSAT